MSDPTCISCGSDLDEQASFCGQCGTPVDGGPRPEETTVEPTASRGDLRDYESNIETQVLSSEARNMALLCHLASFAGFVVPLGNVIGPLVVWLMKRDISSFVDDHGKEALNFQITMIILFIISAILVLVFVGILMLIALSVLDLIFTIMAAVRASNGEDYRYPISFRFIK